MIALFDTLYPPAAMQSVARKPGFAIVAAMKISWIVACLLALSACQSGTSPAEGEESPAAPEPAAAEEAPAPAEAAPTEDGPAAEPDAPPPTEPAVPAVQPDPNAPRDVAAPPKTAKRSESGLAWKVLKKGKGKRHPGKFDTVTMNYTGWTPDGRMFDNSARHGGSMSVVLNRAIFGISEGIQMMTPGEKRRLWIPGKIGYGEPAPDVETPPQQPLGMLVFDIELISFEKAPVPPSAPKDVAAIPAHATRSDSGLAWVVLEEGAGTDHPIATSVVEVDYTMWTADGDVVESTALRSGVDTMGISRLVPGWTEAMGLMVEGERRLLWLPEDLAFKGAPHRPAGMIVIDVKLVQIRRDLHQVR